MLVVGAQPTLQLSTAGNEPRLVHEIFTQFMSHSTFQAATQLKVWLNCVLFLLFGASNTN